jgi:hypothetical protein
MAEPIVSPTPVDDDDDDLNETEKLVDDLRASSLKRLERFQRIFLKLREARPIIHKVLEIIRAVPK